MGSLLAAGPPVVLSPYIGIPGAGSLAPAIKTLSSYWYMRSCKSRRDLTRACMPGLALWESCRSQGLKKSEVAPHGKRPAVPVIPAGQPSCGHRSDPRSRWLQKSGPKGFPSASRTELSLTWEDYKGNRSGGWGGNIRVVLGKVKLKTHWRHPVGFDKEVLEMRILSTWCRSRLEM